MRKIMRNLFKSLWYCSVDRCYIVLNDMNFEKKVYAGSDEESIKEVFKDCSEVETTVYTHPASDKFIDGKNMGNSKLLFVKAKK